MRTTRFQEYGDPVDAMGHGPTFSAITRALLHWIPRANQYLVRRPREVVVELARLSPQWNRKTAIFCELFPDLVQPESADAPAEEGDPASGGAGGGHDRGGNLSPWVLGFVAIACAVALGAYFEAQ